MQPHRQQPSRLPRPWDSPGKNTGMGCHFLLQCMKVESEVAQSCPTLSYPMDCSLPGSSIHGIFQARVLEWVAIAFSVSNACMHAKLLQLCQLCLTLCDPKESSPPGSTVHGIHQARILEYSWSEYWSIHWSGLPFPSPMTNLDSILKSRDITWLTKFCLVKAVVFPVVMYGCESCTIKKAECRRIDAFHLWSWRTLESPLDCKEIQPVNPKGSYS